MVHVSALKQIMCLLSCQRCHIHQQLPEIMARLLSAAQVQAAGFCWPDSAGALALRISWPQDFCLPKVVRKALLSPETLAQPIRGKTPFSWLGVPMRVGGVSLGRLWVIDVSERDFTEEDLDFLTIVGNQLALALENHRLYGEVQQLADRRGELLKRVIATQDERCRRISRELHDEISQSLTAMALDIEAVEVANQTMKEAALQRLSEMRPRLLATLEEINRIVLDLRPTLLDDLGLIAALRWFALQRLSPLGVKVHVENDPQVHRLEPHLETTLYRIAQEAINNIARHAHAQNVWLVFRQVNGQAILSIQDDGCGFDPNVILDQPNGRVGMGLFSMKERAAIIGADAIIDSALEKGTWIIVKYPGDTRGQKETLYAADPCPAG